MDNKIYVFTGTDNKAILKFPQYDIETVAYIGKNGVTKEKVEGDGKTPIGEFGLGLILNKYRDGKNVNGLTYIKIIEDMYWVDDYKSKYYNKLVRTSQIEKDWKTAEHLIDYPIQYEYLIEIKTNPRNIPKKGSAIFLHCESGKPTAGCIAIDRDVMRKIIENVNEYTKIEIY